MKLFALLLLYPWPESSLNSVTFNFIVNAKSNQHYIGGSGFVDANFCL